MTNEEANIRINNALDQSYIDYAKGYLKGVCEAKAKELWIKHDGFRSMRFDVPTEALQDFIKYETYKELMEDDRKQ